MSFLRTSNRRILVVEDNRLYAELMALMLEKAGYEVSIVGTLKEGMWTASIQKFDAVTLDLTLPDATRGISIRGMRVASPSTPILVLSGNVNERDYREMVELGADDCIAKPPEVAHLVDRIERAILMRNEEARIERLEHCAETLQHAYA